MTGRHLIHRSKKIQKSGLSASAGSHNSGELSLFHFKTDPVDCFCDRIFIAVKLFHITYFDDRIHPVSSFILRSLCPVFLIDPVYRISSPFGIGFPFSNLTVSKETSLWEMSEGIW